MELKDRVVVITGSGGGIGEACARRFSDKGAHVVVTDVDTAGVERVTRELGVPGLAGDVRPVQGILCRCHGYAVPGTVWLERPILEPRFGIITALLVHAAPSICCLATAGPLECTDVAFITDKLAVLLPNASTSTTISSCGPAPLLGHAYWPLLSNWV